MEPKEELPIGDSWRWVWAEFKSTVLPILISIAIVWFVTDTQQKVIDQLVKSNAVTAAAITRQAEATEGTNEFLRVNGALPFVLGDGSPDSGSPSTTR